MGFSVKSSGVGTIGWGVSKTDGVSVGLVESQWGCLESQWGRLSMGMLQGVGSSSSLNVCIEIDEPQGEYFILKAQMTE